MVLGVELCGDKLRWSDVRPFISKFAELDANRDGRCASPRLHHYPTAGRASAVG